MTGSKSTARDKLDLASDKISTEKDKLEMEAAIKTLRADKDGVYMGWGLFGMVAEASTRLEAAIVGTYRTAGLAPTSIKHGAQWSEFVWNRLMDEAMRGPGIDAEAEYQRFLADVKSGTDMKEAMDNAARRVWKKIGLDVDEGDSSEAL